jgi:hypothetical protein
MEVIEKVDYKHAEMLVDATLHSSMEDLIQMYKQQDMFETFEDRLICYLIAEAYNDGQTFGRSDDVINALFFDEYNNGTYDDQERIKKQAKAALHNLYKARFIRRDNQNNVYLCSEINFYRTYACCNGIIQLDITSEYTDGTMSYNEYHSLYTGSDYENTSFTDDLRFVDVKKLGPIASYMVLAQRLGDNATPSDFHDKLLYQELVEEGWLSELNGKVRVVGEFKIIANPDTDMYRLVYVLG